MIHVDVIEAGTVSVFALRLLPMELLVPKPEFRSSGDLKLIVRCSAIMEKFTRRVEIRVKNRADTSSTLVASTAR